MDVFKWKSQLQHLVPTDQLGGPDFLPAAVILPLGLAWAADGAGRAPAGRWPASLLASRLADLLNRQARDARRRIEAA